MEPTDPLARPASAGFLPSPPVASGNVFLGLAGGLIGAALGAALWAAITFATDRKIGLIAIVVGLVAGFGVRLLGKGRTATFSIIGALCALVGCMAGDFFAVVAYGSKANNVAFFELLSQLNLGTVMQVMKSVFDPMDLLFYGIAVYEGWRFAVNTD